MDTIQRLNYIEWLIYIEQQHKGSTDSTTKERNRVRTAQYRERARVYSLKLKEMERDGGGEVDNNERILPLPPTI